MNTVDTAISAYDTLNEIVARAPWALKVFQQFGMDTCCGGALPLATAAQHHNLDVQVVLAALAAAAAEEARR